MNFEDVKKTYLSVLGNPQSGVFVDFADIICEAIVAEHSEVKSFQPVKETRIADVTETR
jgi:hypothetical protein